MGRKVDLRLYWKNIAEWCQQTLSFQNFVDNTKQTFAFTPQANFPAHILIFTEGEGNGIESKLPFVIFPTLKQNLGK